MKVARQLVVAGVGQAHDVVAQPVDQVQVAKVRLEEKVSLQEDEVARELEDRVLSKQLVQDLRLRLRQVEQAHPPRLRRGPPRLVRQWVRRKPVEQVLEQHSPLLHAQAPLRVRAS